MDFIYLKETCTIFIYKKFVIFNGGLLVLVEARIVGPSGAGAGFPSDGFSLSKSLQFPDVLTPGPISPHTCALSVCIYPNGSTGNWSHEVELISSAIIFAISCFP